MTARDLAMRARELRDAFDRGFAAPGATAGDAPRELLHVRAAGEPFAIALDQVAALHVDAKIVDVPATAPELLGVIAVRAHIVPTYDLRAVLGLSRQLAPRWLVVARAAPAAFAFDGFDGLVRTMVAPAATTVELANRHVSIIDLAALCAAVHKER
jgi:CheW-like domain